METKTRINPDTGVHEIEGALGWKPLLNDDGEQVRTNPDTGVRETQGTLGWVSDREDDGDARRVNPETGVREKEGLLGWKSDQNDDGDAVRINPETGIHEKQGVFGWTAALDDRGRRTRVNPESGEIEAEGFMGFKSAKTRASSTQDETRNESRGESDSGDYGWIVKLILIVTLFIFAVLFVAIGLLVCLPTTVIVLLAGLVSVSIRSSKYVSLAEGKPVDHEALREATNVRWLLMTMWILLVGSLAYIIISSIPRISQHEPNGKATQIFFLVGTSIGTLVAGYFVQMILTQYAAWVWRKTYCTALKKLSPEIDTKQCMSELKHVLQPSLRRG